MQSWYLLEVDSAILPPPENEQYNPRTSKKLTEVQNSASLALPIAGSHQICWGKKPLCHPPAPFIWGLWHKKDQGDIKWITLVQ